MKKLILFFIALFSFGICFAGTIISGDDFDDDFEDILIDGIEEDDDDDFGDDIDMKYLVYTPQTSGWTIGGYFSILEIKPTFSFIQDSFEIELSCNIVNFDTYSAYFPPYGVGPGVSIGYISNPFDGGIQNCVGLSYVWYPIGNTHIGSIYYRFGVRSRFGNGFITEFKLPIVAYLMGCEFVSVANIDLIPMGLLYSLMTVSVGYKFYF